jgi:hypothetical protein
MASVTRYRCIRQYYEAPCITFWYLSSTIVLRHALGHHFQVLPPTVISLLVNAVFRIPGASLEVYRLDLTCGTAVLLRNAEV